MTRPSKALLAFLLLCAALPARAEGQIHDSRTYTYTAFDRLEYGHEGDAERGLWDAQMWIGGDYDKLWIKSEGEFLTDGDEVEGELQALWSHLLSAFWDVQIGGRLDVMRASGRTEVRGQAVIGLEGLAPYWFEIEPALFLSHEGDLSLRLAGSYDAFITQRIILQGRAEGELAAQAVPEFGIGSGLVDSELGFRLRYEIDRKFAPFVGWRWERRYGDSATMARALGERTAEGFLVVGLKAWF